MFLLTLKNGNPSEMCSPGDDPSSSTGTTLSPASAPKGKKMRGRVGSLRQLTELASASTHDNTIAVAMFVSQ